METKDKQTELSSRTSGSNRISKEDCLQMLKAYCTAVKAVCVTSKQLSLTFQDIYESHWKGEEDIGVITESEDLSCTDYEEKLNDQVSLQR